MSKTRRTALAGAAALVIAVVVAPTASALDQVNTNPLRKAVTVNGILRHERALQAIANANLGTRVSGTAGFDASADYVKRQLVQAGYKVSEQSFEFPFFQETAPSVFERLSPEPRTFTGEEYATMSYSASGDVTAALAGRRRGRPDRRQPAEHLHQRLRGRRLRRLHGRRHRAHAARHLLVRAEGAERPGRRRGRRGDLQRGPEACRPGDEDRSVTLQGTLGAPGIGIPVVGTSYDIGAELTDQTRAGAVSVHIFTETISETRTTKNVIADYKGGGDPSQTILLGSHLDSVAAGPGINDNGSGTATDLETAIQVAKLGLKPRRALRFAFWGAEEEGLLGSQHYVDTLGTKVSDIYANLNFDMLASPNYVRFVYDGDGSDTGTAGPPGSAQIEALFNQYYAGQGLATDPTEFDGRSDYGPFIDVGIPAGGLFSGAEGKKTDEQAAVYGGIAGQPYDACYHQACDTTNNLNTKALNELGDGVAHAAWTLAKSKSGLFEDQSLRARKAIKGKTDGPLAVR